MSDTYSKRFLVTTSDLQTWKQGTPLLLLGEWCRLFSREQELLRLSVKVHQYHWADRSKFSADYHSLEKLYEEKLAVLSESLGSLHAVSIDVRYWRIILGPWLRFFIDTVFDRFELIRTVVETESVEDTWIHNYSLEDWIPADFQEFYNQFRNDAWNHIIFSECIKASQLPYTQRETELVPERTHLSTKGRLKRIARYLFEMYGTWLPERFNKVVMVASYIPSDKLRKLQRSLGQLPYIRSPYIRINERIPDYKMRRSLLLSNSDSAFENVLDKLIIELIPFAYVENFSALKKKSLSTFPNRPSIIFTANAYQADDGFKLWAAHHTLHKVPLVIEQHGGHFGIGLLNQTEDHQVNIADVFASWGWQDNAHKNVCPLPAMKLETVSPEYKSDGDILLTTASYPRYFYCHFSVTIAGQFPDYLQEQVRFSNLLNSEFFGMLKIRPDADIFGWEIHSRLKAAGLESKIDTANAGLMARLKDCRVCVSTYNATVFLETLAANFPTLVFFDPSKYEIRQEAMAAMDSLKKVGILHDTPESAARFLNENGADIEKWWNDDNLQSTRKAFCQSYAHSSEEWITIWAKFFKDLMSTKGNKDQ